MEQNFADMRRDRRVRNGWKPLAAAVEVQGTQGFSFRLYTKYLAVLRLYFDLNVPTHSVVKQSDKPTRNVCQEVSNDQV
jgi:hypothetical protein